MAAEKKTKRPAKKTEEPIKSERPAKKAKTQSAAESKAVKTESAPKASLAKKEIKPKAAAPAATEKKPATETRKSIKTTTEKPAEETPAKTKEQQQKTEEAGAVAPVAAPKKKQQQSEKKTEESTNTKATKKAAAASKKKEEEEQLKKPKAPKKTSKKIAIESDDEDEEEKALREQILGDLASSDEENADSSEDEEQVKEQDDKAISKNKDVVAISGDKKEQNKLESVIKSEKRKGKKATYELTTPGAIFIGHLPRGFNEKELREYFSQFGTVKRVRLARNTKTGQSKHFGFVEFASAAVAEIAAETMDKYLLDGHLLKCQVVPADKNLDEIFKGRGKLRPLTMEKLVQKRLDESNKPQTVDQVKKKFSKLVKRDAERRKKIKEAGIKYDFPGFEPLVKASKIQASA